MLKEIACLESITPKTFVHLTTQAGFMRHKMKIMILWENSQLFEKCIVKKCEAIQQYLEILETQD